MSHFARNQRRLDQVPIAIPPKNPKLYSMPMEKNRSNERGEVSKKDEKTASEFRRRLCKESEDLGSKYVTLNASIVETLINLLNSFHFDVLFAFLTD